jgi:TRAP-type transport system large permease protein
MEDIIKGVWPLMVAQLIVPLLLILFPAVVTVPAKCFAG